jgi:hypothetical protein
VAGTCGMVVGRVLGALLLDVVRQQLSWHLQVLGRYAGSMGCTCFRPKRKRAGLRQDALP